jgi:hypothetical protein
MIQFRGELSSGRKSFQVTGEYQLAPDDSVRGTLRLRDKISPGDFTLTTEGGLRLSIVIPMLLCAPSRQKKGFAKSADFEGRLVRSEGRLLHPEASR